MGFKILEPDEELTLKRRAENYRNKNTLSIYRDGEWVAIEFDGIDYIGCDEIAARRFILTDDPNYDCFSQCKCAYYTEVVDSTLEPAENETRKLLLPEEKPEVFYHSSISQHQNKFSVYQRGEWVPISYDVLDYIGCDHVESHRAIMTDGDDVGFEFDVNEMTYYTDNYLVYDTQGVRAEKLQHWFGEGTYEKHYTELDFLNADNGSLGVTNAQTLRIGLDYALAEKTLPADE